VPCAVLCAVCLQRFSWQTCKTLIDKDGVELEWGDEGDADSKQQSITALWSVTQSATRQAVACRGIPALMR
jgi:hypothetical protein